MPLFFGVCPEISICNPKILLIVFFKLFVIPDVETPIFEVSRLDLLIHFLKAKSSPLFMFLAISKTSITF
jgi:hypothetical protein